jgi:SAM-dependent methyltransferase
LWEDRITDEVAFWRAWLADDKYAEQRDTRRRSQTSSFPAGFAQSLGAAPGALLRVLDVGSGPIPALPRNAPKNPVELVSTDPLAGSYGALLDEYGFDDVVRPMSVKGEELSSVFPEGSFHFVHIANALDHCEDPARTLAEMYRVCSVGGLICILSKENEGEAQRYNGLHQWNLEADDQSLWLWTPSFRQDLLEGLGSYEYAWCYVDLAESDGKFFRADVRKRSS